MGSLSHIDGLACRLEESFRLVGGKESARLEMEKLVWPHVVRCGNVGPNDPLWIRIKAFAEATLRKPGEEYESYDDWLERAARLWLTASSVRHLLVKWAQMRPDRDKCHPPYPKMVQRAIEPADLSPLFEGRLRDIETIERARLEVAGVEPAPPLDFAAMHRRFRCKLPAAGNLTVTYLDSDRSHPVGILDYDVVAPPETTAFKKTARYEFAGHAMDVPIAWGAELRPTRMYAVADMRQLPPRFEHDHLATYHALELLFAAQGQKIPLVAKDRYEPPAKKSAT